MRSYHKQYYNFVLLFKIGANIIDILYEQDPEELQKNSGDVTLFDWDDNKWL